ncbi:hypothetical protein AVEN_213751-1 [Araneus ventricosus]|uniref:Uncharacterized protein n=1 Tax=Araneus ventricosus TaxID=182803 RepID=A0A4Y1ZNL1_ARAVE|nr:hypothetical protein AVEN_213751-1 [Araneus ventricosus]
MILPKSRRRSQFGRLSTIEKTFQIPLPLRSISIPRVPNLTPLAPFTLVLYCCKSLTVGVWCKQSNTQDDGGMKVYLQICRKARSRGIRNTLAPFTNKLTALHNDSSALCLSNSTNRQQMTNN